MAPGNSNGGGKKRMNKGAWTAEEDRKLYQYIELLGPKRWKTIAVKAGLNRCGKSCRLRWLNYLRPNIKRGDISDAEEDLILRLHKLLGNRWSLIAGRLPGRTDNEIKNYWNSHLSKKLNYHKNQMVEINPSLPLEDNSPSPPPNFPQAFDTTNTSSITSQMEGNPSNGDPNASFDLDNIFDFSMEERAYELEWVSNFLDLDRDHDHDHDANWIAY